ncbi:MAG TPA: hypothetical protein VMT11_06185 [Myxococcaceae bacterium]|nr:hypothetical protein [Myxococcaceae bacterium]
MLALAIRVLLLATPVLSEADLKVAERLAWRAGVPKGVVESLSTDLTGDGVPDVVLLTRTADRLVLFVAEGPVSPVGRWWRVDLHRGTDAGELCVPASAVRVHVEDHGVVSHALECDREQTGACPTPQGRALRVECPGPGGRTRSGAGTSREQPQAARCPAVHVFFDGSDLRFWSGVGTGGRSPSASIPAGPFAP